MTKIDRNNPVWLAVEAHVNERLALLRLRLEGDIDESTTIETRSRIRELKLLLDEMIPVEPLVEESEPLPE